MSMPHLLVIEGDTAASRAAEIAATGSDTSGAYADLLRQLWPGVTIDIAYPADPGATLPAPLASYDGIAITGSGLHVYRGGPAIDPQIALVREALTCDVALFGSCWGLQVLTVAGGGAVRRNPKGRELGVGRNIRLTEAGRTHAMYVDKPQAFSAPTVHLDEVETMAGGSTLLATNAFSEVQAFELRGQKAVAWAVQYHPEYPLREIAAIVRRAPTLVTEGFFADEAGRAGFASDLDALDLDPGTRHISWRLGIDDTVLDPAVRTRELRNWITGLVIPGMTRRGRG
jgi:GMP synthase (glutamine-hydrolysing)